MTKALLKIFVNENFWQLAGIGSQKSEGRPLLPPYVEERMNPMGLRHRLSARGLEFFLVTATLELQSGC